MWIVRLALRRPYTIAVFAILIFLAGTLCLKSMLVDIFPVIDIPVVGVVWQYTGLPALDMERRVVILTERAISTSVNGVSRIESQSIPGIGLLRIYFQPGTDIGAAIAQMSSVCSTVLRSMPPGIQPPIIIQLNASNVPVAQLTISSDRLKEEALADYGLNFLRVSLFTIPGIAIPAPYGGKSRQINVDVDPSILNAKGLSPFDVTSALNNSNIIVPAGTARIGGLEYNILLNSSPDQVADFKQIPVKVINGAPILLGDVAQISDSFADQTNIVRVNGKRATYLNLLKKADASTLTVLDSVKAKMPSIQAAAPAGMNLKIDFDQSVFVKAAIESVLREAGISSILVSMMILLFLASWRSVIVVCTSIPLAIFCAIIGLKLTGNSINIMTLGGLSLAIGMLVDDATVEVENIHRNRNLGLPLTVAILHGAQQIALPAIMATLAICIVFFPVVLLEGPARFLFTPMALSVVFSMLASYLLSRTLVPLLSRMLMQNEDHSENSMGHHGIFLKFSQFFDRLQEKYTGILTVVMGNRTFVLWVALGLVLITLFLPFIIGRDFFPASDTGIMKLHCRAPAGTRIEETEKLVIQIEERIRKIIPSEELQTINAMIGVPTFFNLAFVPSDNVAAMDAEILVSLNSEHHSTSAYMSQIREELSIDFPGSTFFFQPADIINQVLNFGLSSPIDVQFEYPNLDVSYPIAQQLIKKIRGIPGATDVAIKQVFDYPTIRLNVDRVRASQLGLAQIDIANSMLISLSSSTTVAPSYFLNPANNVNYSVAVKVPLENLSTIEDVLATPITPIQNGSISQINGLPGPIALPHSLTQRLGNLVSMTASTALNSISHDNVQRVINITANVENRDLGSVVDHIEKEIKTLGPLPTGMKIKIRGQGEVMNQSFKSLGLGLLISAFLVYLLMVILFQSWLDPLIVMVAVPGALVGILWTLLLTGTTINVNSFMGSIMAVGIAASNSILLVSFANDVRLEKHLNSIEAALEAGKTRLRPVIMTAFAMILGMLPAALALGEGGEQNAPLGKAVIGGLLVATCVTLFIVPVVYSLLRTELPTKHLLDQRLDEEEKGMPV